MTGGDANPYSDVISTPEEIELAVTTDGASRSRLFLRLIADFGIDALLDKVSALATTNFDREDVAERAIELGISRDALRRLDSFDPPVAYTRCFCLPENLMAQPEIAEYYRNVAALSSKVMKAYGASVSKTMMKRGVDAETAYLFCRVVNTVMSELVLDEAFTPSQPRQLLMLNLGDSFGGSARNEVGRLAALAVVEPLIMHFGARGWIASIDCSTRPSLLPEAGRVNERFEIDTPDEVNAAVSDLKQRFVKFKRLVLTNGVEIRFDSQFPLGAQPPNVDAFATAGGGEDTISIMWAGEIKGGADPAGSDEHWKTQATAIRRIMHACRETDHPDIPISFFGMTVVGKVADDVTEMLKNGYLASAYNIRRIIDDEAYRNRFLKDMERYISL